MALTLGLSIGAHAQAGAQNGALTQRRRGDDEIEQFEQQVVAQRQAVAMDQTKVSSSSRQPTAALGASSAYTVYLPLLLRSSVISGRVTLSGAPAVGESIQLRTLDGTAMSSITDANGAFVFVNPPATTTSSYYVRYYNASTSYNNRLAVYLTRNFLFDGGADIDLGTFDIADIGLVSPAEKASVTVPQTFRWNRRTASLAAVDSYVLELRPENSTTQLFKSDRLGYADNAVLAVRPFNNATPAQSYSWGAEVVNPGPDGNQPLGLSYYVRKVTISN